jgi:hypothetical protein
MAEFLFDLFMELVCGGVEFAIEEALEKKKSKRRDEPIRGLGTV